MTAASARTPSPCRTGPTATAHSTARSGSARFFRPQQAEVARVKAAPSLDDGADPDELFFVSSPPWLTFSAISLPTPTPADSNPRITFGKFTQEGDRVLLPVNLTANHALVDGLHLAAFFDGMVQRAAHPEEYF